MTPTGFQVDRQHDASVAVMVVGGSDGPGITSAPNEAVHAAVLAAINESGIFRASEAAEADYQLDVVLARVNFPIGGFDVSVGVEMIWNLSSASTQETVWQSLIETGASGGNQTGLLTGKAIEENIREALTRLAAADLP